MTDKNVWFVTGAGRGMGVDIAKAALAAGHAVVATGRNTTVVAKALGAADDLLIVPVRAATASIMPPELGILDQEAGMLDERIRQLSRIRQAIETRKNTSAEIGRI